MYLLQHQSTGRLTHLLRLTPALAETECGDASDSSELFDVRGTCKPSTSEVAQRGATPLGSDPSVVAGAVAMRLTPYASTMAPAAVTVAIFVSGPWSGSDFFNFLCFLWEVAPAEFLRNGRDLPARSVF